MPKYLMVFDSNKVIPDDAFEAIVKPSLEANPEFKFCYAMNCQGLRKEIYEIQDKALDRIINTMPRDRIVEAVTDDISSLFNI